MEQLRILIDNTGSLNINQVKYVFKQLFNIVGLPCVFIDKTATSEIDIYYGNDENIRAKFIIRGVDISKNSNNILSHFKENDIYFLNFLKDQPSKDVIINNNENFILKNDIIYSVFYLLNGFQNDLIGKNKHGHHIITESYFYKNKLMHLPIINQYVNLFRKVFAYKNPLPIWKDNKKYAIALSHDVDYPEMINSVEALRYLLKNKHKTSIPKLFSILKGGESFWRFGEYIKIEREHKMKSAFYFCSIQGSLLKYFLHAPNPFYDINSSKFSNLFKEILEAGFEVGLHASYLAYKSKVDFQKEINMLAKAANTNIYGNRHHYWHLNPENNNETLTMHNEIGLQYDTSLGYEQRCGFRNAVCSPFHVINKLNDNPLAILQLPPTIMDDHLFGHAKYSYFDNAKEEIDSLINVIKQYNGLLVVNFHVRVLNETFFPNWGNTYKYILETVSKDDDFYCDTPINIAKYWLERENKINQLSLNEN